jgi:hypothetical protein
MLSGTHFTCLLINLARVWVHEVPDLHGLTQNVGLDPGASGLILYFLKNKCFCVYTDIFFLKLIVFNYKWKPKFQLVACSFLSFIGVHVSRD